VRTATLAHQAVEDQVLAVLRDAQGFPLSTLQVCELAGPAATPPDAVTWRRLNALAARGLAERVRVAGSRSAYWRAVVR
jgi:hypothetical protein